LFDRLKAETLREGQRWFRWSSPLPFLCLVALVVFVWPAFAHAIEVWITDEEFTYGFLIPPIAIGMLWWKRDALRRSIGPGHPAGLSIVLFAVLLTLFSRRTEINNLAGIAVTPLIIGMAVYLGGWGVGRVVAFPATFLIFGLGLYRGLLNSVGFTLQDITTGGAAFAGRLVGLDIVRDGLTLHAASNPPQWAFVVAQSCSGMNSLLSLLSLAAVLLFVAAGPLLGRTVVIAGVLPLVIVANVTRVTLVLLTANSFGQDAALGFFHGASSLVLFGVALAGMLALSRIVGCELPTYATASWR
jgi:exosortase